MGGDEPTARREVRSQKQRILDYLMRHDCITRIEAFERLAICELSSRILELEADGHKFARGRRNGQSRHGYPWTVTEYSLLPAAYSAGPVRWSIDG